MPNAVTANTITANTITAEMITELRQANALRKGCRPIWLAAMTAAKFVDARPVTGFRRIPASVAKCVEAYNACLRLSA